MLTYIQTTTPALFYAVQQTQIKYFLAPPQSAPAMTSCPSNQDQSVVQQQIQILEERWRYIVPVMLIYYTCFSLTSSDSCHKKMLLESLTIPLTEKKITWHNRHAEKT